MIKEKLISFLKKAVNIIFIIIIVSIIILLAFVAIPVLDSIDGDNTIKVFNSHILPYEQAGYYNTYEKIPSNEKSLDVDLAFSILSFLENLDEKNAVVEKISCKILELQPIEDPVIHVDAVITDDTLKIFVANNGWGTAKGLNLTYKVTARGNETENFSLEDFSSRIEYKENVNLPSGEVTYIAGFKIDKKRFKEKAPGFGIDLNNANNSGFLLHINVSGEGFDDSWTPMVYLNRHMDEFSIHYSGSGDRTPSSTLFAVLKVRENPAEINFSGIEAYPYIDNAFRIETVLVPDESCFVKCKNIFLINGHLHESDTFTARVAVPVFTKGSFRKPKSMIWELSQVADDPYLKELIYQKYKYDPSLIYTDK